MKIAVSIHCDDARWKKFQKEHGAFIEKLVVKSVSLFDLPKKKPIGFALVLTSDKNIQALNRDYRHKDKPTNVLSFPQLDDFSNLEKIPGPLELGDIILAHETILREAKEQNKTLRDHVAHLAVHGTLHLLGYDHMTPRDARDMETIEIEILEASGIKNPY